MKTGLRTFALGSWCVLMLGLSGPGCQNICEEQGVPLYDNRDHKLFPDGDDWMCIVVAGVPVDGSKVDQPPPPLPDVSSVSPPDPAGPKDPNGVVNAAIAHQSCFAPDEYSTVNELIQVLYLYKPYFKSQAALAARTSCFKDMTEGCESYRKCMGIATSAEEPLEPPLPCKDGVAYTTFTLRTGYPGYMWRNCVGLGYECQVVPDATGFGYCEYPNLRDCDINQSPARACVDGEFLACQYEPARPTDGEMVDRPRCSDYGLMCTTAMDSYDSYCRGDGPDCWYEPPIDNRPIFEYSHGINCQNDTLMRVCVGGGETDVDCASLGQDFKCLKDPKSSVMATCGYAWECDVNDYVQCDGTSLVVCDAGRIRKVDCKALGFNSCNPGYGFCE